MAEKALEKVEPRTSAVRAETEREPIVFTPRCDILDTPDEVIVYADMPGVEPQDVDVRFERGELVIQGTCPDRHAGVNYLTSEYEIGNFYRAITIGEEIDAERITAEVKHGVLTVHLPKSETVKPKRIVVKGD
jgi:HSP20 family protein